MAEKKIPQVELEALRVALETERDSLEEELAGHGRVLNDAGDWEGASIGFEGEGDAERGDPWHMNDGEHLAGSVIDKGLERDREGNDRREKSNDACPSRPTSWQQEERQSPEKGYVDRPSKHNQKVRSCSAIWMAVWLMTPRISWG